MTYEDVPELQFITPVENLPSILAHGILSHREARRIPGAQSVAKPGVQDRRTKVVVPGGRPLHEYANLYFHARNPMLYLRKEQHAGLCVLSVRREVLRLPGVVVTDMNVGVGIVRFAGGVDGLRIVDKERVYAMNWQHADELEHRRHKAIKCAEVLVPERVVPGFVRGAYVSCEETRGRAEAVTPTGFLLKVTPAFFFR